MDGLEEERRHLFMHLVTVCPAEVHFVRFHGVGGVGLRVLDREPALERVVGGRFGALSNLENCKTHESREVLGLKFEGLLESAFSNGLLWFCRHEPRRRRSESFSI